MLRVAGLPSWIGGAETELGGNGFVSTIRFAELLILRADCPARVEDGERVVGEGRSELSDDELPA